MISMQKKEEEIFHQIKLVLADDNFNFIFVYEYNDILILKLH